MSISVTILTKNSRKYLSEVLDALKDFDEVVLFDNGSTDDTIEIGQLYGNVRIYRGTFEGFGPTHNRASSLARNDWILSIDSDEVVSKQMAQEILSLSLDRGIVYLFPRRNYFNGRLIKGCGWYPDRQLRLYNRTSTCFDDAHVHEAIISKNLKIVPLKGPITHYSYATTADFLSKMQAYSTLFAEQYRGKKASSPLKAIGHGIFAFFKSFILKRGICDGYEGFIISAYNGHTAFYKYIKLYEANLGAKRHPR